MNPLSFVKSAFGMASGYVFSRWRACNVAAFHLGRSGSRLLGDLVKQNSHFVWDGELLSPGRLDGIAARWPLLTRDPLTLVRLRMTMAGRRSFGFETQPSQVEYLSISLEDYLHRLEGLGFDHFILLERENHLRRIVSMLVARKTSNWHLKHGEAPSLEKIELDVDRLLLSRGRDTKHRPLIEHIQRDEACLSAMRQLLGARKLLCLSYEKDLAQRPELAYERVCDFTQTDVQPVTVRFARTNPYDLSEVISNYEEVVQALKGTRYEWMLGD